MGSGLAVTTVLKMGHEAHTYPMVGGGGIWYCIQWPSQATPQFFSPQVSQPAM